MDNVETNAGVAICCAPSRMARMIGFLDHPIDGRTHEEGLVEQEL
jgi:hypothetical protein